MTETNHGVKAFRGLIFLTSVAERQQLLLSFRRGPGTSRALHLISTTNAAIPLNGLFFREFCWTIEAVGFWVELTKLRLGSDENEYEDSTTTEELEPLSLSNRIWNMDFDVDSDVLPGVSFNHNLGRKINKLTDHSVHSKL
jgi:hypothetical protein